MTKLKQFVNTYNKIIFVLAFVLTLTSLICSAIISYNTNQIEVNALAVEHNHAEHMHEEVSLTAYFVTPNLDNSQMVATSYTKDTLPIKCATCDCTVKGCSKCYKIGENDKGEKTYTPDCAKSKITDTNSDEYKNYVCPMNITAQPWYDSMMSITGIIDQILNPVLIILGTAGSIFVIVLGINFSKAESADKREEAKKRMINAIIGIVVTLLFLILVKLFTANAGEIVKFVNGVA